MNNNLGSFVPGQPFNPYKLFHCIFIPEPLVCCDAISPGAKLCYGRLTRYAGENGECFPSMQTLRDALGYLPGSARSYVAELEEFGLIKATAGRRWDKPIYFPLEYGVQRWRARKGTPEGLQPHPGRILPPKRESS